MKWKWRKVARLWGVQLEFENVYKEFVSAEFDTVKDILRALSGREVTEENLDSLISQAREKKIFRLLEPCYVQKSPGWIKTSVYFPEGTAAEDFAFTLRAEGSSSEKLAFDLQIINKRYPTSRGVFRRAMVTFRKELPPGIHDFELHLQGRLKAKALLLSPPRSTVRNEKKWGVFAPLYALHSDQSWGIGDLGDLANLQKKTAEWGGDFVGTLPLLAFPYEEPGPYSPYSPSSKLFWNEIFLDIESLLQENPFRHFQAKRDNVAIELDSLNQETRVDYAVVYKLKRKILEEMAHHFFLTSALSREYQDFLQENPLVKDYADFYSKGCPAERDYHLFVQFQMARQMKRLHNEAKQKKAAGLYLDFPLGTSFQGFDGSHFAEIFLKECSVGAPPDLLFKHGQNWNIAPVNGDVLREQNYDYFIRCLRHHMQFAKILRLDHIMGLQRLYVIPPGKRPDQGIYLRYNAEEFFAILAIEAWRHGVQVVGENLGTVSNSIQDLLKRYDFLGMWVFYFEAGRHPLRAIDKIPPKNLACLNTHDMSPFQGYLEGRDLQTYRNLGILSGYEFYHEDRKRHLLLRAWHKEMTELQAANPFFRWTTLLARSSVECLLINVEDLWRETQSQNVPGTVTEHPNWQKKLKYPLELWTQNRDIVEFLEYIHSLRHQRTKYAKPSDIGRSLSL